MKRAPAYLPWIPGIFFGGKWLMAAATGGTAAAAFVDRCLAASTKGDLTRRCMVRLRCREPNLLTISPRWSRFSVGCKGRENKIKTNGKRRNRAVKRINFVSVRKYGITYDFVYNFYLIFPVRTISHIFMNCYSSG